MIIKQLSIFLQNKIGRFSEVASILGEAGVNLQAFTVSENSDFGILRLIVDKTPEAVEVLRAKSFAVSTTDVVYLECADVPGELAKYMERISQAGVSIEYMYAFSSGNIAKVVIRADDVTKCEQAVSL